MDVVNYGTFNNDHICRNAKGVPIGRIILKDNSSYFEGMNEIPVVLLKVPLSLGVTMHGLEVYIDGVRYKLPTSIDSLKLNRRDRDWVMTNFYLRRSDNESD